MDDKISDIKKYIESQKKRTSKKYFYLILLVAVSIIVYFVFQLTAQTEKVETKAGSPVITSPEQVQKVSTEVTKDFQKSRQVLTDLKGKFGAAP